MRHRKRRRHKGKRSGHMMAIIINLVKSFIRHKEIVTTDRKAKLVRSYIEKAINIAKTEKALREVIRSLKSFLRIENPKLSKKELAVKKDPKEKFVPPTRRDGDIISILLTLREQFKDVNGGYVRLIHEPLARKGDSAPMCRLSLVSANTNSGDKNKE